VSAPAITSITFDKPGYHQGDLITATVAYTGSQITLTISASGGVTGTTTGTFTVLPSWGVSDGTGRVWTFKSDNGSQAVFTATA
jgi:hypothetical protein